MTLKVPGSDLNVYVDSFGGFLVEIKGGELASADVAEIAFESIVVPTSASVSDGLTFTDSNEATDTSLDNVTTTDGASVGDTASASITYFYGEQLGNTFDVYVDSFGNHVLHVKPESLASSDVVEIKYELMSSSVFANVADGLLLTESISASDTSLDNVQCPVTVNMGDLVSAEAFLTSHHKLYAGTGVFIEDTTNHVFIAANGFVLKVYKEGLQERLAEILDPNDTATVWAVLGSKIVVGGSVYSMGYDAGLVVNAYPVSSNCVIVHVRGMYETISNQEIANGGVSQVWFYVYENKIYQCTEFVAASSIAVTDSTDNGLCYIRFDDVTNNDAVYENSGTEVVVTSDGQYNNANYIGLISEQVNIWASTILAQHSGTVSYGQYVDDPAGLNFWVNDGSLNATTHRIGVVINIDSADRLGTRSTSASRMAIADEQLKTVFESLTKGSTVTDLAEPYSITASPPLATDGARHLQFDTTDENIIFTADETYLDDTAFVIHTPLFNDGSKNCIIDYMLFEDNINSNVVVATYGQNAAWFSNVTGAARDTSNDSTPGKRGQSLDSTYAYGTLSNGNYNNAFFVGGGLILSVKPLFNYNTSAYQTVFYCKVDADNLINLRYNPIYDQFELYVVWGGISSYNRSEVYPDNVTLQLWHDIVIGWHYPTRTNVLIVNGKTSFERNTGVPTSLEPQEVSIGAEYDSSSPGAFLFDRLTTLDEMFLPFGGFDVDDTDNHANPDSNLSLFWDCVGNYLTIGSGSVSYTGAVLLNDGPDGGACFSNTGGGSDYVAVQTDGNIVAEEGTLSIKFQFNGVLPNNCFFVYAGSGFHVEWVAAYGALRFTFGSASVQTSYAIDDTVSTSWHRLNISWKAFKDISIDVDGRTDRTTSTVGSAPPLDENIVFTAQTIAGDNGAHIKIV